MYFSATNAFACAASTERCIFNHIMNHEFAKAFSKSEQIDPQTALIPSAKFYNGLITWQAGRVNQDEQKRQDGIELMRDASERLSKAKDKRARLLGYALAAGHTARVLLYEEEYTTGILLGKNSLDAINQYRESDLIDAEGLMATNILLGIVAFYKASAPDYIKKRVRRILNLDEDQSRKMLESSAVHSEVFGDEAKRILLMEATWSFPRMCGYLPWISSLRKRYSNNPDFTLIRQGLLLRCGKANAMLDENTKAMLEHKNKPEIIEQLQRAKWRALAQLGKVTLLENEKNSDATNLSNEDKIRLSIAFADALYIHGNTVKANDTYKYLLKTKQTEKFTEVLRKRLNYGFNSLQNGKE